ncbi:MAG: hypothetical protein JOZ65_17315 [Chloroflexi bacterium]|nr:hypothetical protein [Chloroflexota bacterium]
MQYGKDLALTTCNLRGSELGDDIGGNALDCSPALGCRSQRPEENLARPPIACNRWPANRASTSVKRRTMRMAFDFGFLPTRRAARLDPVDALRAA